MKKGRAIAGRGLYGWMGTGFQWVSGRTSPVDELVLTYGYVSCQRKYFLN